MPPLINRRGALLGAVALATAAPIVSAGSVAFARKPLSVVATTGMIADAARQVGGDLVDVRALMGPGVDPHAYRQTRSDLVALTRSDLVLWHGLYLEAQLEELLLELASSKNVVAVADTLSSELLIGHDDYPDRFDPHLWMEPELWAKVVQTVEHALSDSAPEMAATFAEQAQGHIQDVLRLGGYASAILASVPAENRVLFTSHDAFNYFGRAYGFDVLGIQGISTESEAGLARIAELVNLLVSRKIGAVFVESSVSDRNIRALIEGAAARGHEVVIGGELFSDAMGELGTYEGTYLGMIDHNVTTIARALGGNAPLAGMDGKLAAG